MVNLRELQKQKQWAYHFDDLSQEIQRKILGRYFLGETKLYMVEKAREYSYTKEGKLIVK